MKNEVQNLISVDYMPNGRPCPAILTAEETAILLRLEGDNPERTLKFYRDEGQLKGIRLGRKIRYRLVDVRKFLDMKSGGM